MIRADALEARVMQLVVELLPNRAHTLRLSPTDSLRAAGLDSLRMLQLIDAIEDDFAVSVEEEDLEDRHFATVAAISALLSRKTEGKKR